MKRRSFLKKLATTSLAAAASGGLAQSLAAQSFPLDLREAVDDEMFWNVVRKQFPVINHQAYFNSATMGPSPYQVLETIRTQIWEYESKGRYVLPSWLRSRLAKFVHVEESKITLTHNTTEAINIVAWGVPLKKGDEVIMTTHEHAGNALPWLNRKKLHGIKIRPFEPAPTAAETMNRINDLITKKTRVIAVPHITCTTGQVLPAKEIIQLARDKDLLSFFDGAHGLGALNLNLHELDPDFYAVCGHKWLCGPTGTGMLYVKQDRLDTLQAIQIGTYTDTGWELSLTKQEVSDYVPTAHRFDYGTQSSPLYRGMTSACDFMDEIGMERVQKRIFALSESLQNQLIEMEERVEMLTPTEARSRGSIIGFKLKNIDQEQFLKQADEEKIRVRQVAESDLNSIRISTHIFNSKEEIDRLVALIRNA